MISCRKDMTLKLCQLIEYYIRSICIKKRCSKCAPKVNSRSLFNFINYNPKQPLHARNSFTNQIFWKRIIKKLFKKITLFFFHHPYVTRISFVCYVIRMSLVCTRMSSVCHSYVLVCHPYFTRMWFYHEPSGCSFLLGSF